MAATKITKKAFSLNSALCQTWAVVMHYNEKDINS